MDFSSNIPVPVAATVTQYKNAKQIVTALNSASGAVIYTVPANRVFKGYIIFSGTTQGFKINGKDMYSNAFFMGNNSTSVPGGMTGFELTLVAGTYITENTANVTQVLGVEYDA
jgi:hypothetical protein